MKIYLVELQESNDSSYASAALANKTDADAYSVKIKDYYKRKDAVVVTSVIEMEVGEVEKKFVQ